MKTLSKCCKAEIRYLDCELCKTEEDHECIFVCSKCGAEPEEIEVLEGTQITSVNTLGSMYDNQTIRVTIDKDNKISFARIRVADLLPILSEFDYMIDEPNENDKRRSNTYLQPIIDQTGVKEYEQH